jgi:hypothetical protein
MDDDELSLLNEFNEILQSEVYVDLDRLRNAARHGIPAQVRGKPLDDTKCPTENGEWLTFMLQLLL